MNSIKQWYEENSLQITWFLIGFLVMDGCTEFGRGNWQGALFSWALALINYKLNK